MNSDISPAARMLLFSGANCMPLQSVRSEKSILGGHDYLEDEHVITKGQKIFSEIKSPPFTGSCLKANNKTHLIED
jgi:hypothetical protein